MKTYQDIENERSVWLEIKRKLEISFSGEDYVSFDSSEIEIMKDLYLKSDLIISKGSRLGKKTNPNLFIGLYIFKLFNQY